MQNIQDVWIRIQDTKKQQKEIALMYKDALDGIAEYQKIKEQLKELGLKKKQFESEVQSELGAQYEKLHTLKKDVQLDKQLLADLAINNLMEGQTVTIKDPENNEYEPVFSVSFKKLNEVRPGTSA